MKKTSSISLVAACLLAGAFLTEAEEPSRAPAEAVEHWQDLRFGMFIHWGPVALTGHEIGWSRGSQTPIEKYDQLYKRFNPTEFNAREWVETARAAGMKYIVLTSKHHDGFCLWDSAATEYDIMNSPFGRDVVAELAAACRAAGMDFGLYYSTCDWWHPAFPNGGRHGRETKPTADLQAYDRYLRAQTRELIENYGPLLTIWFDVPQSYDQKFGEPMVADLRRSRRLSPLVHDLNTHLLSGETAQKDAARRALEMLGFVQT